MICNSIQPINYQSDFSDERKDYIKSLRNKFPSLSKQLKLIEKQHDIIEVAYSGNGFFNEFGRYTEEEPPKAFKFKVDYRNRINREEHGILIKQN